MLYLRRAIRNYSCHNVLTFQAGELSMTTYKNFIHGKWIQSNSGKSVANINPGNTDDVIADTPLATRIEARQAVEAAAEAFRSWRSTPAPTRGKIVNKAARLFEDNKEDLAQILTREEGKTIAESRGELQRSINVAEFCAGESRRLTGETIPSELPLNFAYTIKQPLGVVACVTPWNFPVAIPVWKIAPALISGNTVLLKPAHLTTSHEVRSREGAKVQCEMVGNNPVLILEDADLDLAVESTAQGAFGSSGQRCTATSRAVVINDVADEFVERMAKRAESMRIGNGMDA